MPTMTTAPIFNTSLIGLNEFDSEQSKKRRRRHLITEPEKPEDSADVLPSEIVSRLLNRSTAIICRSVGFTGASQQTQEAIRKLAEDYYLQMLKTIGLFTHAHHRSRPTVIDFEEMCNQSYINLSTLETEVKRMPSTDKSIYPLQPPHPQSPPDPDLTLLLGPQLDGSGDNRCRIYDHLPPFPSRHTYQATPVFAERPTEPRTIREKATAEARLAEQALRTLLAVSANKKKVTTEEDNRIGRTCRKEREGVWEKTLNELNSRADLKVNGNSKASGLLSLSEIMDGSGGGIGETNKDDNILEVVVNSDSQFWRKGRMSMQCNGSTM